MYSFYAGSPVLPCNLEAQTRKHFLAQNSRIEVGTTWGTDLRFLSKQVKSEDQAIVRQMGLQYSLKAYCTVQYGKYTVHNLIKKTIRKTQLRNQSRARGVMKTVSTWYVGTVPVGTYLKWMGHQMFISSTKSQTLPEGGCMFYDVVHHLPIGDAGSGLICCLIDSWMNQRAAEFQRAAASKQDIVTHSLNSDFNLWIIIMANFTRDFANF